MKKTCVLLCAIAFTSLLTGCAQSPPVEAEAEAPAPAATVAPASLGQADLVARGEYLVTLGHCNDCHTPWIMTEKGPGPDMTRMLSGHPEDLVMPPPPALGDSPWVWIGAGSNTAFAGPWGVSYALNLTPDPSGLGAWTEEIFVEAIRTGQHWGQSRPILPPMPWPNLAKMTDDDLRALFAYLQSIPPIENHVPDAVLAPPPEAPTAG